MSKLLEKVQAAGYIVSDRKNALGIRIITIHSPYYVVWYRAVLNPKRGIRSFLAVAENTVLRCHNYINNPVTNF